jgi:hypothetical protein
VRRLEAIDTHEVDAGEKASESRLVERPACAFPQQGADLEVDEADLLLQFAAQGLLIGLSLLATTSGRDPPAAVLVAVPEQQDAFVPVDDGSAHVLALGQAARPAGELLEPA